MHAPATSRPPIHPHRQQLRSGHGIARRHRRQRRPSQHPRGPAHRRSRPLLGRRCVHVAVRQLAASGRRPGRPPRRAAVVHRWARRLHRRLRDVRRRARHRLAHRRPGPPRDGRGALHARIAVDPPQRLSRARRARAGNRHLEQPHGRDRRERSVGRRCPHPRIRMAEHLPHQRPDRRARRPAGAPLRAAQPRVRDEGVRSRCASGGSVRTRRLDLGADRTVRSGLVVATHRARVRLRCRRNRRVRRARATQRGSDAAAPPLSRSDLHHHGGGSPGLRCRLLRRPVRALDRVPGRPGT